MPHRSSSRAQWTTSLVVRPDGSAVRASTVNPNLRYSTHNEGDPHPNLAMKPETLLKKALPDKIDLSEVEREFELFKDAWQFCYPGMGFCGLSNPVFNRHGDLLFELRPPFSPNTANATSTTRDHASSNTQDAHVRTKRWNQARTGGTHDYCPVFTCFN